MKQVQLFVAAVLALAMAGCGGSSGGRTPDVGTSTPRLEAVVRVQRTNLRDPQEYASFSDEELQDPQRVDSADLIDDTVFGIQDPENFQTGEQYVFQLVRYTSTGERIILPATFSTAGTQDAFGTLATNSGLFLAGDSAMTGPISVFADYQGQRYTAKMQIRERQARVIGAVYVEGTDAPADGVAVEFYNETGLVLGRATTAYDGTFRASLPTTATRFSVDADSLGTRYYRSFVLNGTRYIAEDPDCRAVLEPIVNGTQRVAEIQVTTRVAGQAGPAADGCSDGGGDDL